MPSLRSDAPRTAVIGAGISGLTTGKMLGDYGVGYTCFEASDRIGGNWSADNAGNPHLNSSAYTSLHIDTSKHQLSFKDFPMPAHYPDFPHHSQIKEYLDAYAEAFGLLENIELSTAVLNARRRHGGGWELDLSDGSTREFDFLVVGNGHHWDPRYPDFPGTFTGESIHSHSYIEPTVPLQLTGKRVLVVGLGNSAADITVEISSRPLRNEVHLSTRSGAWIVPKYFGGQPLDRHGELLNKLPGPVVRRFANAMGEFLAGDPSALGLKKPEHRFLDAHATQSVELPLRLGSGDVTPRPNVTRLDGRTVHFEDGTASDFDVIIYATGYNITFPFFDPALISAPGNHIRLFKRIFKPGIDDLAFAGFAQSVPTLFPFVECQARLIAAYAAGTYRLPSPAEMERVITADEQLHLGTTTDRPRHTQQVNYFGYEKQLRTEELPAGRRRAESHGPALTARTRTRSLV